MGNASSEVQSSVEEITDENWSKQLEKYLEIENADVQADLIYLFDGKAVSGELTFITEAKSISDLSDFMYAKIYSPLSILGYLMKGVNIYRQTSTVLNSIS